MCDFVVSDAKAMLPFKLLDAASSVGVGSSVDLGGVTGKFTMQAIVTGLETANVNLTLTLEGSLDGVNWYPVDSGGGLSFTTNDTFAPTVPNRLKSNSYNPGTARAVKYVRANLRELNGGTSPTVTLWVVPVDVY